MHRLALLLCTLLLAHHALARETPRTKPAAAAHYDQSKHLRRCPPREQSNSYVVPCKDRGDSAAPRFVRVCMSGEDAGQGHCPATPDQPEDSAAPAASDWACTRDDGTGLTWSVHSTEPLTWHDAADAAHGPIAEHSRSARCGHADWRLPALRELRSIIVRSDVDAIPARDADHLPSIGPFDYWTADAYAPDPARAWVIDFSVGSSRPQDRALQSHAVPVRGGR